MTAHTPEELHEIGQKAIARLDAWLKDIGKQESPIEGVLDDLGGLLDHLVWATGDDSDGCYCGSVETRPHPAMDIECLKGYVGQAVREYDRLRELWEART